MSPRDTRSLGSIRTITRYPVWSSRVVDGSCSLRVTSSDSPTVRIPATSSMAALLDTSIGATTAVPGILSTYTIVACTLYSTCVCTVSPTMAVCIGWLFLSQAFNLPITKLQDLGVVESIKFELSCRHHIITVPQSYLSHSFLHEVIIINCVLSLSHTSAFSRSTYTASHVHFLRLCVISATLPCPCHCLPFPSIFR